ncbi:MAG: hypothetical protein ACK44N_07220 [Bacteroidota bacterium]|jgi:hypothetical protein
MSTFLIVSVSLIVFFFVLVIAISSKGFRNKFGPEWVPGELQIRFNIVCRQQEDWKKIRFYLTPTDADNVLRQIDEHIRVGIINLNAGHPPMKHKKLHSWSMVDMNTFEYRNNKTNKLKAVFYLNENMLDYFK